jgi:hypothetical protein
VSSGGLKAVRPQLPKGGSSGLRALSVHGHSEDDEGVAEYLLRPEWEVQL